MNVVEIEHLTYAYPGAAEATLNDVSLTIEKGDFLAIVGNNGCGKSTLCKTLNGLIPQFITGEYTGRVTACGLDAATTDIGALAQKVGYVYQDFENQIIRPTVLDDASYALPQLRPARLPRARPREALRQCGLQDREDDFIWQLSGGQTHLLALAGVLSLQPEVLDPRRTDRPARPAARRPHLCGAAPASTKNTARRLSSLSTTPSTSPISASMCCCSGRPRAVEAAEPDDALQRVDELQSCNIFPPQVTIAAPPAAPKRRAVRPAPARDGGGGARCLRAAPRHRTGRARRRKEQRRGGAALPRMSRSPTAALRARRTASLTGSTSRSAGETRSR